MVRAANSLTRDLRSAERRAEIQGAGRGQLAATQIFFAEVEPEGMLQRFEVATLDALYAAPAALCV